MEWEKDSVMWNWVRVTIWPSFAAPTPTIRCQFSSSIIPPPLLRLLLLPQLPVTVHRNPISHQPRHPRLWLVILLYDFNDTSTISPYRHLSTVQQFYSSPALQQQQPLPLLRPPTTYVTLAHNFYKLQYQWLQLLPAPVPVTTTSTSSSTDIYWPFVSYHRRQKRKSPWVKTSYPVISNPYRE